MFEPIILTIMLCSPECSIQKIKITGVGAFEIQSQEDSERVRIYNVDDIDAANCFDRHGFKEASVAALADMLGGGRITLRRIGKSFRGETLAVLTSGNHDLGTLLINNGYAISPSSPAQDCR